MNDLNRLKEILKLNPFAQKADVWLEMLLKNPCASFGEVDRRLFLLEGDEYFADYKDVAGDSKLWPQLVPQPFIGDPRADIWYVPINPGFTWSDYYDYCGIGDELKNKVLEELSRSGSARENFDWVYTSSQMEREMFERRCNLLIGQLRLNIQDSSGSLPFYPLDESFNTISKNGRCNSIGTNFWWRTALTARGSIFLNPPKIRSGEDPNECAKRFGKELFVIEYFPYHSKRADRAHYNYDATHPYRKFVKDMIEYAVNVGKTILFRSAGEVDSIGINGGNLYLQRNCQRVWLTRNNFERINEQEICLAAPKMVKKRYQVL